MRKSILHGQLKQKTICYTWTRVGSGTPRLDTRVRVALLSPKCSCFGPAIKHTKKLSVFFTKAFSLSTSQTSHFSLEVEMNTHLCSCEKPKKRLATQKMVVGSVAFNLSPPSATRDGRQKKCPENFLKLQN